MSNMLKAALYYAEKLGYSVIPIDAETKKPRLAWKEYQTRKATSAEITSWYEKWPEAGVGIVTGNVSGICVIDVDEEQGYAELEAYIPDSMIIPTVNTPKGGKHFYFATGGKATPTRARILPGVDIRGDAGFINAAPTRRTTGEYRWEDGLKITEVEVPVIPDGLLEVANGQKSKVENEKAKYKQGNGQKMFTPGKRDDDLFHTAHCLFRGGMPDYETAQVIGIIAKTCWIDGKDEGTPDEWAAVKVQSALNRAERVDRNLAKEVREFVDGATGTFELMNIYNALNLKERKEKKSVSNALTALHKEGAIERHGGKNGHYRKVDTEIVRMNLREVSGNEHDIILPFHLNTMVRILPKNVIVVAGNKNAGKSALLMNIVHLNAHRKDIRYLNSEGGVEELALRIKEFEEPMEYWDNVEWIERCNDFADLVVPDGVNIIDYLALDQEKTYLVGNYIDAIYRKLTTGIAIIAIQKKYGASVGVGGESSLERPRLYLTLEDNKVRIQKAKIFRNPFENPNGLEMKYKLVRGCQFFQDSPWDLPDDKPKGRW